jgi:hypothetical protein
MNEYDHEPVRGLPQELPEGEEVVWQGEPTWGALARRVFHVHAMGLYFGALMVIHAIYQSLRGVDAVSVLSSAAWQLGLAVVALGILSLMALAYSRSTVYTITNRRLVFRTGVAVPMMINIPWDAVQEANLRLCRDGTGDIAFKLAPDERVAYWALWPNVRPWHLGHVQPMIRGLESPEAVAKMLARTVTGESWTAGRSGRETGLASGDPVVAS